MLFFIGFGILVVVLVIVVTAIAQPPNRWVEKYVERQASKFPPKKSVGSGSEPGSNG